jgi:hypothetical protein
MLYGRHSFKNVTDIMVRLTASAIHLNNNQIVFMILYTEQCWRRTYKPGLSCSGPGCPMLAQCFKPRIVSFDNVSDLT